VRVPPEIFLKRRHVNANSRRSSGEQVIPERCFRRQQGIVKVVLHCVAFMSWHAFLVGPIVTIQWSCALITIKTAGTDAGQSPAPPCGATGRYSPE
jgi:hypothetical protein